jgi:O-antigen ligase
VAWTWLGPRHFKHAWLGIALCLGGTAVSFTRAAWLAAVLVIALGFFGPLRVRANQRQLLIGIAGAAVITIVSIAAEHTGDYYQPLSAGPGGSSPPAAHGILAIIQNQVDVFGRVDQIRLAAPEITSHLFLGNGTASYGVRHLDRGTPEHIANLELSVLYDTGILGLLIFLAFMVAVAWEAWKHRRNPLVAGLGMTVLVIAITNTATETTELMISWLLVGLLLMAVDVARAEQQTQEKSVRAA